MFEKSIHQRTTTDANAKFGKVGREEKVGEVAYIDLGGEKVVSESFQKDCNRLFSTIRSKRNRL